MSRETAPGKGVQNMRTPPELFAWLNGIYDFELDAAADYENKLCEHCLTAEQNALELSWFGYGMNFGPSRVFVNPPFSLAGKFAKKCAEEAAKGCVVVAIFNCSTGSEWFRKYVHGVASEVLFLSGRVSFIDPETGKPAKQNPRDTMIVVWGLGKRRGGTEYVLVDSKTFEEI